MKALLRSLLALTAGVSLLAAAPAQAQTFPNSNLDSWAPRNGIEPPTNWLVTNDFLPSFLPLPIPGLSINNVTKTTDARTGPFAAKLETATIPFTPISVPAFMILGTRLTTNAELPGGLPFTGRPAQMQFGYKLTGPSALADSAAMGVQLTRTVGGNTTVIAEAYIDRLTPATAYTLQTLPLDYFSSAQPDTVRIIFVSGSVEGVTPGTVLQVDDISFTGTVTTTRDAALAATLSVYPNPSADGRYVLSATEPALLAAPLTVFDATGRVVRSEVAPKATTAPRSLDLSGLPGGVYTLQVLTSKGIITKKLITR